MSRFEPVLRRAEAALDVPRPLRARIVTELAADLESLYGEYLARGLREDDAAARAVNALGLSDATAGALTELHAPRFRRWTAALSARSREKLERVLVTLLFLALAVGGAGGLAQTDLLENPSFVTWPLAGLTMVLLLLASALWIRLVIVQRDVEGDAAVRAVGAIALAAPLLGAIGAVLEMSALAADLEAANAFTMGLAAPALQRAAQAVALGLTLGIFAFLNWFHLRERIDVHVRAAAELARAHSNGGE